MKAHLTFAMVNTPSGGQPGVRAEAEVNGRKLFAIAETEDLAIARLKAEVQRRLAILELKTLYPRDVEFDLDDEE